ncbi:glycosyltransferase [bacterium]|nr:glycosyltransferase [bacterium]
MPKKILIFSLAYYPKHVGGAEIAIKEITERISPEEFEFHMVTLRFDSTLPRVEKIGNVLVHRIGFTKPSPNTGDLKKFPLFLNKYLFQFTAAQKALQLHKKYHYNAIWAMMAHSSGVPAALFKFFHPKVGYNLTLQEGDPPEYIEKLARPVWPLFTRAFTSADTIQCISTFLALWAKRMGFAGEPIIIPNAVNTKHFSQEFPAPEIAALKEKLEKRIGDVFLITTSRLVHKNAVDDVIKSLTLLPANIKFLVLGIGPDEEMLENLAKSEGVETRVKFLGQVSHNEMPKYLKASDIFIRPSRSEGMGNSFVEAFAAELPVIATQEGGIVDFLFDPERNPDTPSTGRAVPLNSPKQIARAVRLFLEHPEKTREIIANAKKLAFEKYDWDLIAKDMKEEIFKKVVA